MEVTWAPHPQTYNMTHYQGHCQFFSCQRAFCEPILNNNGNGNGNGSAGADMGLDCRAQLRAVASLTACRKGRVMQKWIDISPLTWHSRIHIHQARRCMLVLLSIGVAEFVKLPRRFIALGSSRPLCSSACSINSIFPSTPDSRPTTTIFSRHHLAEESFFCPLPPPGQRTTPDRPTGPGPGPGYPPPSKQQSVPFVKGPPAGAKGQGPFISILPSITREEKNRPAFSVLHLLLPSHLPRLASLSIHCRILVFTPPEKRHGLLYLVAGEEGTSGKRQNAKMQRSANVIRSPPTHPKHHVLRT